MSCHHEECYKIIFWNLYNYLKEKRQFSEDGIRNLIVATNYIIVREMLQKENPEFCMKEASSEQHLSGALFLHRH